MFDRRARPAWLATRQAPAVAVALSAAKLVRMLARQLLVFCLLSMTCGGVLTDAQSPVTFPDPTVRVLTHREQNELVTPWIKKRFDTVLPGLMTREGIDMWIIPTREYNEDPVFASMSPITY